MCLRQPPAEAVFRNNHPFEKGGISRTRFRLESVAAFGKGMVDNRRQAS